MGEPFRLAGGGHGDDNRAALGTLDHSSDGDGTSWLRYDENRIATTEDSGEARFIGEQRGEFEERHGASGGWNAARATTRKRLATGGE
jgi:hypothetical protein